MVYPQKSDRYFQEAVPKIDDLLGCARRWNGTQVVLQCTFIGIFEYDVEGSIEYEATIEADNLRTRP